MAWYKNGTVKLTNGNAVVTGAGTSWADNKMGIGPGQMLLVPGAGTVQMYEILRVDSNTQLILASNFNGTTAAASAYAIPSFYVDSVPDFSRRLAAQLSYYQSQMDGWQQIMTGSGSVSITAPDGTVVDISSFAKLTSDMSNKATLVSGAVPVNQGGTGSTTAAGARTNLGAYGNTGGDINGTVTIEGQFVNLRANASSGGWPFFITFMAGQGNNVPYVRLYQENSGDFTVMTNVNQTPKYFQHTASGDMIVPRNIQCLALTQTSDREKKEKIENIPDALNKLKKLNGVTFIWKDSGMPSAGVIAQEMMEALPESVSSCFDERDEYAEFDETYIEEVTGLDGVIDNVPVTRKVIKLVKERDTSKRTYAVEYSGPVALLIEAVKELSEKVSALEAQLKVEPTS